MEMRTFVLTFPLFSEYDLISKRKREGDAVTRGNDGKEEDVTLAVTVQGIAREVR